jgi:Tol biopolymer transport system component
LTLTGVAPEWSPDGNQLAFTDGAPPNIFVANANEPGQRERLTTTRNTQSGPSWSPESRHLLYAEQPNEINSETKSDVWAMPLAGDRTPFAVVQTPFQELRGRISPDGRWIAYTTNEPGRDEIYVQRFPSGAARQRISTTGGDLSTWRRDGRELFYRSPDGMLMSVSVQPTGDSLSFGQPTALFSVPLFYDVSPDGQRVLAAVPVGESDTSSLVVVTNWQPGLRQSRETRSQ